MSHACCTNSRHAFPYHTTPQYVTLAPHCITPHSGDLNYRMKIEIKSFGPSILLVARPFDDFTFVPYRLENRTEHYRLFYRQVGVFRWCEM